MRAVVVVPTYNERDNLKELVTKVAECVPDLDILVVDDASPDGTGRLADELSEDLGGKLQVLHREAKQGLGRAYLAGFREALARGYDVILQMDADMSHDPAYIPKLLARMSDSDVVCGSRYVHGINVVNWDFKRLLLSKAASKYVQLVTRMPFSDPTGGFKAWRREALESLGLEQVFANGYLFQIEMTYRAHRKGLTIREVPIIFYERSLGRSKMDFRIISEAILGVVRLRLGRKC